MVHLRHSLLVLVFVLKLKLELHVDVSFQLRLNLQKSSFSSNSGRPLPSWSLHTVARNSQPLKPPVVFQHCILISDSMSAPGMTQKSEPKLRASCDGCYHAKLKCSKERPVCPRCRNLGLVCHYSPSQRMGKPRKNLSHHQQSTISLVSSPDSQMSSTIPPQSTWPHPASTETLYMSPNPTVTSATLQTLNTFSLNSTQSNAMDSGPDILEDNILNWQQDESFMAFAESMISPFSGSIPDSDQTLTPAQEQTYLSSPGAKDCGCYHSILHALSSMQIAAMDPQHGSLDNVLNDSKAMVATGEAMLNCTCSEDSTLIMMLSGLIAKHLAFFCQDTVETTPSPILSPKSMSPTRSRSKSSSSDSPQSNDANLYSTPSFFPNSRITIGKYTIDGEDEERLRTEIILMELSKLSNLLTRFRNKFACLPASYESQTYETLMEFLSKRLCNATLRLQHQKQTKGYDGR